MAGTFRPTVIYLICRPFAADDDDDDDYSDADDDDDEDEDDDEPVKRIKQVKGQQGYNNGR